MSIFNCSADFYLLEVESTLFFFVVFILGDWLENFPLVAYGRSISFPKIGVDCNFRGLIRNMFASVFFSHSFATFFPYNTWQSWKLNVGN